MWVGYTRAVARARRRRRQTTGGPISAVEPPSDLWRIARNVRTYRERAGLSQNDMADKMGVVQGTYVRWERDDPAHPVDMQASTLLRLATHLQITVEELCAGADPAYSAALARRRLSDPARPTDVVTSASSYPISGEDAHAATPFGPPVPVEAEQSPEFQGELLRALSLVIRTNESIMAVIDKLTGGQAPDPGHSSSESDQDDRTHREPTRRRSGGSSA